MSKWRNPIIKEFSRYLGCDPLTALKKECKYLYKISGHDEMYLQNKFVVDIDKIANLLKLKEEKFQYTTNSESKAYLVQHPDKIQIELNSDKIKNRYYYRFIIAHEIGHWIIRSKVSRKFSEDEKQLISKYNFEEELLCQHFASELLMPENPIFNEIDNKKINKQYFEYISNKYQVSLIQAINRFVFLNDKYIAVYWNFKKSPTSTFKTLRVGWVYPNQKIRETIYIPLHATAKNERFDPNIIDIAFKKNKSIASNINITNLGDLYGNFFTSVINPNDENSIFEFKNPRYQNSVISIIKTK
ncbi:MAG: ImmA/IrrE family metallo-endopeptidase [Bacteroidales bacterium]|nr:ImmA/IrrE family metallo-endopeptidase [Bacteroidales bacterium]